jgi:hypothetical protein
VSTHEEVIERTRQHLYERKPAVYYAHLYPILRDVAREHGYTLALHGSMARDLDLIAVPWTDTATDAETLIAAMREATDLFVHPNDRTNGPTEKPHGRQAWGLVGTTLGWVDLSIMPRA